jgi:predicted ATPase
MPRITAIELENFQAIERRTRIELKPITLLYGPNSAGKSSVFDALQLLQAVLDPSKFDQVQASDMLNRWARYPDVNGCRETSLAVEFEFFYDLKSWGPIGDFWQKKDNWPNGIVEKDEPSFWFDLTDDAVAEKFKDKIVRIELTLKVVNKKRTSQSYLSEFYVYIDGNPILSLEKKSSISDEKFLDEAPNGEDLGFRWLTIFSNFEFDSNGLLSSFVQLGKEREASRFHSKKDSSWILHDWTKCNTLSPCSIKPIETSTGMYGPAVQSQREHLCINASDIGFYFGAMFSTILRDSPFLVNSDRRAPRPEETLTIVDLGLRGWWDKSVFSPSSPAFLFKSKIEQIDKHFQGLAEVAHADIILKASNADFWGGQHASKNIAEVQTYVNVLEQVNHHLGKSLFTEKLYRLTSASTLMVPIDLREDDPKGYYALAQPAAVRLFLQDASGQNIDLWDVGSGVPFVLPVLYAVSKQGVVTVQQPELHLHPALQSSLADVFVEELHREGFGQFVIETHSEHFLLRLLRRIKSTTKGTCLSDELRLSIEDVSIYYFDPQVEGGTIVTRQLVTPLGDFYNDWPRGFFSERNIDLFDE